MNSRKKQKPACVAPDSSLQCKRKSWKDSSSNGLAVALQYDASGMDAPEVAFSGEKEIAREILKISRNYNIPVRKSDELAKKLSTLTHETRIPEALYDEVAEIFLSLGKK